MESVQSVCSNLATTSHRVRSRGRRAALWGLLLGIIVFPCELAGVSGCFAGGGPENVFLLVNSNSKDSMTVANHYIDLRKIPATNVYYVPFKGSTLEVPSTSFRSRILLPALAEIEARNLSSQIDYLVYSCDFPWRINFLRDFPDQEFPRQMTPIGSITGATYLKAFVQEKRKEIVGLNTNWYFDEPLHGMTISQAFRSRYHWSLGGKRAQQGLSYMISAMLGVTDGRGNSVEEVVHSLRQAKAADGTKPPGTVYFMKHQGVRSSPRHNLYGRAVAELQVQGVTAKVIEAKFPEYKMDIVGLTCGTAFADLKASGCRFLPGAFCDNLTSAGANFVVPKQMIDNRTGKRRKFQVTVCDFIRHGATAACGTVIEPLSIAQKFPSPSVHVHYAHGCSLGEAFYQSVSGPYQQLLVGDPLCQPWADIPKVQVDEIVNGKMLRGKVEIVPAAADKKTSISNFDFYVDGLRRESCQPGNKFLLDTTTIKDGYHELRVVARDDTPIETQGRLIVGITVKNGRDAIALTTKQREISAGAKHFAVDVFSTTNAPVELFCNGQKLGSLPTGTGSLQIATDKLGAGPIEVFAESESLRSKPLRLEIAS